MSYTLKDRVLESSVSTGTGDFVLDGAQTGYQGFVNVGDGSSIPYTIQGKNTDGSLNGEWEVGIGTYHLSGNYISRDTVLESSNSNSKVAFSSGSKDIFLDLPGELVVQGPNSATNSDFVAFDGTSGKVIKDSGYSSASFAPATSGTSILYGNGTGGFSNVTIGTGVTFAGGTLSATGSGGDVVGPSSSTNHAIVRFDGTTGKLIQSSAVTIDDAGNIISPDSVQFSGTVPATQPIGTLWFDSSTDSLNFQQNNITQQIGEEIFIYGRASEAITDGQVIAVSGAYGTTGFVTFEPAPIGTTDPTHIIGLATEPIAKNSFGRITAFGIVHGLSTSPGFADGDALWYDPTVVGGYTKTQPSAPNIKVQIGVVTKAAGGTNGSIQVKVFNGPTINDIANIQVTTPTGGQLLTYNATGGYWKNTSLTAGTAITVTPAAGGGITITNSAPDQVVSLTGAGTTTVTGTYPNFTITSNDAYTGTVTSITAGTGLSGGTITTSGTIALANTAVTAGSYTYASITVDAQGRLTSASSGTAPVTSVSATAPLTSTGGTTPTLAMPAATGSVNGYLTSTDWTTFNGKLSNPMTTLGDVIYGGASGTATRLAGNTTTAKQWLSQTGTGTASAAPAWSALPTVLPVLNRAGSTVSVSVGNGVLPVLTHAGATVNVAVN